MAPLQKHLSSVPDQPSLPGIKEQAKVTDDEKFKAGWDSSNPKPESFEQAEAFLRTDDREDWKEANIKIKSTVTLTGISDKLKVVIKCDDLDAEERQFLQTLTLEPPGLSNHKAKIIKLAQEAHAFLRKIVLAERIGS